MIIERSRNGQKPPKHHQRVIGAKIRTWHICIGPIQIKDKTRRFNWITLVGGWIRPFWGVSGVLLFLIRPNVMVPCRSSNCRCSSDSSRLSPRTTRPLETPCCQPRDAARSSLEVNSTRNLTTISVDPRTVPDLTQTVPTRATNISFRVMVLPHTTTLTL